MNAVANRMGQHGLLFLVTWICLVQAVPISAQEKQNSASVSATARREAKDLAQKYRRANDDLDKRKKFIESAIEKGRYHSEKLLEMAIASNKKSLENYGTRFAKQIEKAKRITPVGVVASSSKLKASREKLIQLAEMEIKLRAFVEKQDSDRRADEKIAAAAKEESDPSEFEKQLAAFSKSLLDHEQKVIESWLTAQGFGKLSEEEVALINSMNKLREQAGLGKLEVDYKLCFAARDHSRDMVDKGFFSHNSPVRDKKTFSHRAYRVGTVAYAENICQCKNGDTPFGLWLNSKPHKRNMLGRGYNTVGVGRVGNKWTALFGRTRKLPRATQDKTETGDRQGG